MAYTLSEATKIVRTALQAEIVETLIGVDPLLANLPIVPLDGNSIIFNEENALSAADHIALNGNITASTPTYSQRTRDWKMVISDQSVAKLVDAVGSGTVDQVREAIRRGAKACAIEITRGLVVGNEGSVPEEVDGLEYFRVDAPFTSQNIEGSTVYTARAVSFDILDQLIDKASLANLNQAMFVMPRRTIRSIKALMRASGGTAPEYMENASGRFLMYNGIPIYWNDNLPIDGTYSGGTAESSIYLLSTEPVSGACLFVPRSQPQLVQVEMIDKISNQDNMVARCKAYYGFAVRGPKHFAFTSGITN